MNGFNHPPYQPAASERPDGFRPHRVPVSGQANDERFQDLGLQEALWQ